MQRNGNCFGDSCVFIRPLPWASSFARLRFAKSRIHRTGMQNDISRSETATAVQMHALLLLPNGGVFAIMSARETPATEGTPP